MGRITLVLIRLGFALLLGAVIGWQREQTGKAAGLRTHMLVTLGAALFTVVAQLEAHPSETASRVIQGIVAGIGFLGGGAIIKLSGEDQVKGMTTSAGIWAVAAIGVACGAGRLAAACLGTVATYFILKTMHLFDRHRGKKEHPHD
jgi:putative Mg2+ transporter-C (MgtC) family protein